VKFKDHRVMFNKNQTTAGRSDQSGLSEPSFSAGVNQFLAVRGVLSLLVLRCPTRNSNPDEWQWHEKKCSGDKLQLKERAEFVSCPSCKGRCFGCETMTLLDCGCEGRCFGCEGRRDASKLFFAYCRHSIRAA
jgi:hypothetical protein